MLQVVSKGLGQRWGDIHSLKSIMKCGLYAVTAVVLFFALTGCDPEFYYCLRVEPEGRPPVTRDLWTQVSSDSSTTCWIKVKSMVINQYAVLLSFENNAPETLFFKPSAASLARPDSNFSPTRIWWNEAEVRESGLHSISPGTTTATIFFSLPKYSDTSTPLSLRLQLGDVYNADSSVHITLGWATLSYLRVEE